MTTRVRQLRGLGKGEASAWEDMLNNCTFSCALSVLPPPCKPGEKPVLPDPKDCCGMASCTPAAGSDVVPPGQIVSGKVPPPNKSSPILPILAGAALAIVFTKL